MSQTEKVRTKYSSPTHILLDDVTDRRVRVPVAQSAGEEGEESGVVNIDLIDLVEDIINDARVDDILRFQRNHIFL